MSNSRRLSQLLLASHVGLVLLFAVLLLATGVGTIRSAVTVQARAEAERSVSEARRRLEEWRRELVVGSGLLAEQPTLRFYLQRGQLTKARALVENFHATSAIEYILVLDGKRTIAEIGPRPPVFQTGLAFDRRGRAWRVVRRGIRSSPDTSIVVAEMLGDRLVALPQSDRITLLLARHSGIAFAGATLAGINVVSLFLGQRLTRDYAAAAGMVPYAVFAIGSVLLQGINL